MRGGKRAGAGRKRGSQTKRTRMIAMSAAKKGLSPIEVMLGAMRLLWTQSERAPDEELKLKRAMEAASIAKDAAPYVHPRIASVDNRAKDAAGQPEATRLSDREIARRIAWILMRGAEEPE